VLPLLPVILAGASQEGRSRPIGMILGFVGTFTVVTLALSFLVRTLHVSPDINRIIAGVVLVLLGLVLAVPQLSLQFERFAGGLAGRAPAAAGSGFGGGLVIGAGLGLAWTPCVGPIMASVITLALNQEVDAGAILVTLAFALGTAIPMAAVMRGGRKLVQRLGWFQRHAETIHRVLGIVVILVGLGILFGWDRQIQILLLTWFPGWEQALVGWEPRP
jgi:cytochrome c biogenesis protein CcdA